MRTERDRARSLADVFVGPRYLYKGVGRSGPSIAFASKPTPGVWVPSLRLSFRDHLSFVGRRKYRTRCDCQFARHISFHMSPFQLVFEPSKCPSASTETSVRSKKTSVRSKKKKKKQKNSKKKVRRRTERRRQQQRGGKFQRASLMFFSYTRMKIAPLGLAGGRSYVNCRYGLAIYLVDTPIKQQSLQKHNRSAFFCICRFGD